MNNVTLSGRFPQRRVVGGARGVAAACTRTDNFWVINRYTRGHAIFHTEIDNRQSTEMIYVTDTRARPTRFDRRRLFAYFLLHTYTHTHTQGCTRNYTSLCCRRPYRFRRSRCVIHLGRHDGDAYSKNSRRLKKKKSRIAEKSSFKLLEFDTVMPLFFSANSCRSFWIRTILNDEI